MGKKMNDKHEDYIGRFEDFLGSPYGEESWKAIQKKMDDDIIKAITRNTNPDTLQGLRPTAIWIDECGQIPYFWTLRYRMRRAIVRLCDTCFSFWRSRVVEKIARLLTRKSENNKGK